MIEALGEIVKTIVIIGFLSLFLEILLPGGSLKKYAKFVMGLLVVVAIINPVLQVFSGGLPALTTTGEPGSGGNTQEIITAGKSLNQDLQSQGQLYYEEGLIQQINALVLLMEGVKSAETEVYFTPEHNLTSVVITLTVADNVLDEENDPLSQSVGKKQNEALMQQIREKTAAAISTFYDISTEQIQVSIGSYQP